MLLSLDLRKSSFVTPIMWEHKDLKLERVLPDTRSEKCFHVRRYRTTYRMQISVIFKKPSFLVFWVLFVCLFATAVQICEQCFQHGSQNDFLWKYKSDQSWHSSIQNLSMALLVSEQARPSLTARQVPSDCTGLFELHLIPTLLFHTNPACMSLHFHIW